MTAGAMLCCAFFVMLAACGRGNAAGDVFTQQTEPGSSARTFECTERGANGECDKNKCTQGPGGAEYDCGNFGKDCIDAGHHYNGTKQGGTCSRVKA